MNTIYLLFSANSLTLSAPAPNHGEAQSAESRADFVHKLKIALKELRETETWLKIIARRPEATTKDGTGRRRSRIRLCESLDDRNSFFRRYFKNFLVFYDKGGKIER